MPSAKSRPAVVGALLDVLNPVVAAAGFEIEDLSVAGVGRRSVVRIVVDSASDSTEAVDLDSIATVSRAIAAALDDESAEALIDGAYQLEVTSPGVDRPLTTPRHWRRAVDRLVTVEVDGKQLTGRVVSADTAGAVVSIDGAARPFTWSELGPGRVQIEFNRGGSDSRTSTLAEEVET
jgi:ribosome maturation factor RimP